ncbi:hypothetical protein GEMRC1_008556 [Eukaryota sp. GEM-RC1]
MSSPISDSLLSITDISDRLDGNDLCAAAVGGGVLVFARSDGVVVTYDPVNMISLSWEVVKRSHSRESSFSIKHIFVDPTGRHVLVSTSPPHLFYIYNPSHTETARKTSPLKFKTNNNFISSVGWSYDDVTHKTLTSNILLGTNDGKLFEMSIEGSAVKCKELLYLFDDKPCISGITMRFFDANGHVSLFVVVATLTRLYEFAGFQNQSRTNPSFSSIFKDSKGSGPRFNELPYSHDVIKSELFIKRPITDEPNQPWKLAWITSVGMFIASLSLLTPTSDSMVVDNQLIPFPNEEVPNSVIITDHHLLFCYSQSVSALSLVSEKIIATFTVDTLGNNLDFIVGFAGVCPEGIFIYGPRRIYQANFSQEDRDVWRWYCDKKEFQTALEYTLTEDQKDHVMVLEGQNFFELGQYDKAARRWARTTKPIEEVSVLFIESASQDALLEFLVERLSF